jgi:hypothetical protein
MPSKNVDQLTARHPPSFDRCHRRYRRRLRSAAAATIPLLLPPLLLLKSGRHFVLYDNI